MRLRTLAVVLGVALLATAPAWADRWDTTTNGDDSSTATFNELHHGVVQEHDWSGTQDQDWYRIYSAGRSSYEVLMDGLGSDVVTTYYIDFTRFAASDTATPLTYPDFVGTGAYLLSLRWQNTSASAEDDFVKIAATNTDANSTSDAYVVKAYDTTMAIPRYNNASGQITVLICQNPADYTIGGTAYLWTTTGSLATSFNFSLTAKRTLVQNLASVNGGAANGTAGAITIAQDGRFGDLTCKSVALEPATGFSFDSPGVYKPM
jgi:hypothetical protein